MATDTLIESIKADTISPYDVLLAKASERWKMPSSQLEDLMKRIAFHESKGVSTAQQTSGGPGKGLYQFEAGREGAGHTAARRLIAELGEQPSWLKLTDQGLDASKLTPEQQGMLFLANYLRKEGKSSGMYGVNPENLAEWWFREHNAGPESTRMDRLSSFARDMQDYSRIGY
tara:strand:- start:195 stop:713 length:519 start_codon:yes stop_codon:yes gene_type:complete